MSIKDQLKPNDRPLVMDLVSAAGVDVSGWATSQAGPVQHPASNPAYCYEWAFPSHDRVVLNLWHDELVEVDGKLFDDVNPRQWAELDGRTSTRKRARRFEEVVAHAFDNQLPVHVIVGDGTKRPASEGSPAVLRMERRLLDPEPWFVERYDALTGKARITRGPETRYVDQYSWPEGGGTPRRREVTGEVLVRDRKVRLAALRRAQGRCEICGVQGFATRSGEIYLETHHVTPLSEEGADREDNVAALCANHHREAHYGAAWGALREKLQGVLARHYHGDGTRGAR